jgi:hypothetical protein
MTFQRVAADLAESLGVPTPEPGSKGRLPERTGQKMQGLPAETTLVQEPKLNVGGVAMAGDVYKRPDLVVLAPGGARQIEVVEVTLDSNFQIPQERVDARTGGPSHKRVQIPSTVFALQQRYPGVPIIFNIRCPKPPSDEARRDLNTELNRLGGDVQIIWRVG